MINKGCFMQVRLNVSARIKKSFPEIWRVKKIMWNINDHTYPFIRMLEDQTEEVFNEK